MEVFVILPNTPQGKAELKKKLAKFHADHIQRVVQRLPCPVEKKLELIDAVIDQLKEDNPSTE